MAVRPKRVRSVDRFIAARVRECRTALGWIQQDLGTVLGVTLQQVHRYETGVNRITAGQLYEIACAMDTPVDYFFEGVDEEPRPPTPRQRMLLDVTRNFTEIQNEAHRLLLHDVVRLLAGR